MSLPHDPRKCRFCEAALCFTRICTADLSYDEVACPAHARDLERDAADRLGDRPRTQWASDRAVRRARRKASDEPR